VLTSCFEYLTEVMPHHAGILAQIKQIVMKFKRVYIFGAGGHGKVVADILRAARRPVAGFIDDLTCRSQRSVSGLPVLDVSRWMTSVEACDGIGVALGIGDNQARKEVADRCRQRGFEIVTAVHPAAVLSAAAGIGAGTVIMPLAVVNADARLGPGVIINTGAVIEHDCVVSDYAHISPNAVLGGRVHIGPFSQLGLGAAVLPGVSIGSGSIIGAGAVVVRDIPDDVVAMGVPARVCRARNPMHAYYDH
jgi:sugar O-acyltransferase (sialic acid O-acetyltransferase NeuD family)